MEHKGTRKFRNSLSRLHLTLDLLHQVQLNYLLWGPQTIAVGRHVRHDVERVVGVGHGIRPASFVNLVAAKVVFVPRRDAQRVRDRREAARRISPACRPTASAASSRHTLAQIHHG